MMRKRTGRAVRGTVGPNLGYIRCSQNQVDAGGIERQIVRRNLLTDDLLNIGHTQRRTVGIHVVNRARVEKRPVWVGASDIGIARIDQKVGRRSKPGNIVSQDRLGAPSNLRDGLSLESM